MEKVTMPSRADIEKLAFDTDTALSNKAAQ